MVSDEATPSEWMKLPVGRGKLRRGIGISFLVGRDEAIWWEGMKLPGEK